MAADLRLVHLYPDLLRTYGDRGNVMALARRAEWRGFRVAVEDVMRGEELPPDADLVLIGGGTDRAQVLVGADLARRAATLAELSAAGCVVVGICGGYQVLGHRYVTADGAEVPGLGLLDATTEAGPGRLIGRVTGRASLWGRTFDVAGFENHGGRTRLGPASVPFARVGVGRGNDGHDRTEGAVSGSVVGTYLHGPVLAINAAFADTLLERALADLTGGAPLAPLDDALEGAALRHALSLRR